MSQVSVVIGAVGNVGLTRRCVESARALATLGAPEIVLVDNGSTAAESAALAGLRADVLLSYPTMLGFAAAMNAGVAAASGEIVCLLNNDAAWTQRGWDARLVSVLDAYPGLTVVAPTASYAAHPDQQADGPAVGHQDVLETDTLRFVAVLMRRSTWAAVGGLDERFGLGNYEDDDFCLRARLLGGRLLIDPAVWVAHAGHQTMLRLDDFDGLLATNRRLFCEKWSIDDGATGDDTEGFERRGAGRGQLCDVAGAAVWHGDAAQQDRPGQHGRTDGVQP